MRRPGAVGAAKRHCGTDIVVALSLSNLLCWGLWSVLLNPGNHYFLAKPPGWADFAAAGLNMVLLAALLWVGAWVVRRLRVPALTRAARWAFLLAIVLGLNGLRQQVRALSLESLLTSLGPVLLCLILLGLFCTGFALLKNRNRRSISRFAELLLLVLFPMLLVALVRCVAALMAPVSAQYETKTPASRVQALSGVRGPRVVWLVFDELDYRLAFPHRPASVELPEFDRIQKEAFHARNAFPPGVNTTTSFPGLIIGRRVTDMKSAGPNELMLRLGDTEQRVPWSAQPNVFLQARALGVNSGFVGWYHPYCRIIGGDLSMCSWHPYIYDEPETRLGQRMLVQWSTILNNVPFAFRLRMFGTVAQFYDGGPRWHARQLEAVQSDVLAALRNRQLTLVMAHLPVPHAPWIFDRKKDVLSWKGNETYLDNLVLADRVLGRLRRAMEVDGTWDHTALLITGDHGLHKGKPLNDPWVVNEAPELVGNIDSRVPLLVRLPGGGPPVMYEPEINTALLHDLVLDVLKGGIRTNVDTAQWIDHRLKIENHASLNGG